MSDTFFLVFILPSRASTWPSRHSFISKMLIKIDEHIVMATGGEGKEKVDLGQDLPSVCEERFWRPYAAARSDFQ